MLKKQRLAAMEGKHHDAKPRYTRKGERSIIVSHIKENGEVVFQQPQSQTCSCTAIHHPCPHK